MPSRFYLTTAIDYVNSRPHLGTAYEKITADVIARYKRLAGFETLFVMGNDEHSQNVFRRAKEQGMDPLAYCDQMEREFRSAWDLLDVSYDDFIRTTQPRHKSAVQEFVRRIAANGVYGGYYEGWYARRLRGVLRQDLVDRYPLRRPWSGSRKEPLLPAVECSSRCWDHFRAHPAFVVPDVRRGILRLLESGLGTSRSAARAGRGAFPFRTSPASSTSVRRADQLRRGGGFGTDEAKA